MAGYGVATEEVSLGARTFINVVKKKMVMPPKPSLHDTGNLAFLQAGGLLHQ